MRGGSGAIRFIYILLIGAGISPGAPLSTVRAIKQLTIEDARRVPPVRLTGVVTSVVPEWGGFSLQDSTEGIYIAWPGAVADLRLGQWVEVEGRAMPGNFAPGVNADRVRVIGEGAMPAPEKVTWQRFSTGACDNTYVEVEGVVRTTGILWSPEPALSMRLDVGGNLIRADVRDPGTPPARLVDALVRVRGVCRVISNSKGQFIGAWLSAARPDEVVVEKPGPVDPFDSPLRPMERLFGYTGDVGFEHRTRVQGIATAGTPGGIYIQDGVNGMLVQTGSAPDIRPGDRVEAVGFPTVGSFSVELADALARVTGHGAEPRPIEVQANAVLQRVSHAPAAPDGVLVRIAANVLERAVNGQEEVLILEDGATTFSARVPSRPRVRLLANFRPGSRVSVTGVCVVHTNQQGPRTFDVLLRSPADVATIARAPMTRAAAMRLAGALLGLLIAGAIWLELLRRRVGKQTATIRAQFEREAALEQRYAELVENASDAVYVRDLEGRLLQVNRGMAELTGYSRGELIGMNVVDLLIPEDKERGGDHLSPAPEEEVSASEWRIRTKQGREITVEIKHRCLMEDGRPVLVECIGRDVTARTEAHTAAVRERRRLEEQLHQSQKMEARRAAGRRRGARLQQPADGDQRLCARWRWSRSAGATVRAGHRGDRASRRARGRADAAAARHSAGGRCSAAASSI